MPPLLPLSPGGAEPVRPASDAPSFELDGVADEAALRPAERWRRIVAVAQALSDDRDAAARLSAGIGYPPDAYDQFRRDVPLRPPPPAIAPLVPMIVAIDASAAAPFLIRATLRALQDQSRGDWTACVVAPAAVRDHPVGAFADTDARVRFVDRIDAAAFDERQIVSIDGGTLLDPEALAWLGFALARTGAAAAFADHDHGIADRGLRLVRADPALFGAFDPALLAQAGPPAVVAARAAAFADLGDASAAGASVRNAVLLRAAEQGSVTGVPRVLATRLAPSLIARGGDVPADEDRPGWLSPIPHRPPARVAPVPRDERIAVVMPTRDSAVLLDRAVGTLRATARHPGRLDIVVLDNRSAHEETRALLARFADEGTARTIAFDAPFNWSRASNMGAAAGDAPLLLFANDDIEMLSSGWDDALADALHDPSVGAVGARLIYPDRTIQHAGVAFGFGPAGTEHEGRGAPVDNAGPSGRYITDHAVAAVTGAFLGMRRADFERVGGFDAARLTIAHSDVDLCLKLREQGLVIRYCAAIEAIHHEGATRGINASCAAIAWDEAERADLFERWGDALVKDPGISPYWLRGDAPFELLREPSMREIVAHIDRTARPDPWRPTRRDVQAIRDW